MFPSDPGTIAHPFFKLMRSIADKTGGIGVFTGNLEKYCCVLILSFFCLSSSRYFYSRKITVLRSNQKRKKRKQKLRPTYIHPHLLQTKETMDDFLQPTKWSKVSEFTQSLVGPKCLDVKQVFIGAQVVQAQSSDVHEFFHDKLATLKVDGERHVLIMYIDGPQKDVRLLAMRRNGQVLEAPLGTASVRPTSPLATKPHGFFSILDCEYLAEEHKWLAFDCIVFRAFPQTVKQDFTARYNLIRRTLVEDFDCPNILQKPYFDVKTGAPGFTDYVRTQTAQALHGIQLSDDGLVFQPKRGPYPVGSNLNLPQGRGLKWKPACTLDLVPRRVTPSEVKSIFEQLHGPVQKHVPIHIRPLTTLGLIHTPFASVRTSGVDNDDTFLLPRPLHKLDCVSDFSTGVNAHFTTLALKYDSIPDLPVCVHMDPSFDAGVVEFEITTEGSTLVPVPHVVRSDKALYQANKARTVAGVLWQADENRLSHRTLDDYVLDPSTAPQPMQLQTATHVHPVDNPESLIPMDDHVSSLDFSGHAEHEFKVVQTKRPRAGNIFPATLERNFTSASFVDVLHFERVVKGLAERFHKSEPPIVTTMDLLLENGLRLTAYERAITTKSGQTLCFYETDGFMATRKTHENSVVVHDPELLRNSGYCYRLDTRKEMPELFVDHTFLPENTTYLDFLAGMKESVQNPRKRKGGMAANKSFNPDAFKGYRLVDRQDFAKEVDRDVDVARLRRVSSEPVRIGEILQVEYRGRTGQFHTATVTRVDPTGTKVDVLYDYAVKSLTNYTSTRHIPLVVDAVGARAGIRVKKRRTFEFPGFKVDLTQTRTVQDFRSSERSRLHHVAHRANHCEIEVELLSSVQRNPDFREQLKQVLVTIWDCMKLDENKFLFERVIENPPTPALQEALDAFARHNAVVEGVDPIFVRASSGVSRIIPESDFYSTLDPALDALLGPVIPTSDPCTFTMPDRLDLTRLGHFVDTSPTVVEDYFKRRLLKAVTAAGDDGELHGTMRGLFNLAYNPSWQDQSFWAEFKQRLNLQVIDRADVEPLETLVGYLKGSNGLPDESAFLKAAYTFGEAAARHIYFNQGTRAWWDLEENALAWNDLVDFAHKYALELTRSVTYAQWIEYAQTEEDIVVFVDATRALARLAVIIGAVRIVRDACTPDEIPRELVTFPLSVIVSAPERRVYSLKEIKPFDTTALRGVKPVVTF
jgi:hypothetical protein